LQAAQQAARAKAEQQNLENRLKFGDLVLKARDADLKALQIQEKQKKLAGMGQGAPKLDPSFFEQRDGIRPPMPMTEKDFNAWLIRKGKVQELTGTDAKSREAKAKLEREQTTAAPPRLVVDADGNAKLSYDTGNLKQPNGEDWIIPSETEAKDWRKKKVAADGLVDILDEVRQIREEVGGETSWGNSPHYGRLKVLQNQAIKIAKSGVEGMSSDEDMNKLVASLGADSPASFRDQTAKLDEGREQVVKEINRWAREYKYRGDPISYPDPLKLPRAAKTATESQIENILSVTDEGLGGNDFAEKKTGEQGQRTTRAIREQIDRLRSVVNNEKASAKDREIAREGLERIANEAQSKTVRDYATANAVEFNIPSPEEPR
jgi:hypothetical protein